MRRLSPARAFLWGSNIRLSSGKAWSSTSGSPGPSPNSLYDIIPPGILLSATLSPFDQPSACQPVSFYRRMAGVLTAQRNSVVANGNVFTGRSRRYPLLRLADKRWVLRSGHFAISLGAELPRAVWRLRVAV